MCSSNAVVKPYPKLNKTSYAKSNTTNKAVNSILTKGLSNIGGKFQIVDTTVTNTNPETRFRDDGMCPECFAEMTRAEGMSTCDLCGYCECD